MITDTAVHRTPLEQICQQIWASDFSVRAFNWYHFEFIRAEDVAADVSTANGQARGTASSVAAWLPTLGEWPTQIQRETALKEVFVPKTDLGRKLWALRQKYIAEGGRLYTLAEIQQEVARRRGEIE